MGSEPDNINSRAIRVVVVDDFDIVRLGTRGVLETAPDIEVVGEAANGAGAREMVDRLAPDVVLVDLKLPDVEGLELISGLTGSHPATRVLVLSAFDDDVYVRASLSAGVSGYLLKALPGEELVEAVRAAVGGAIVLDPGLSRRRASPDPELSHDGEALTVREREVMARVAEGLANKQIAARLGVSVRTVEGHLNHIFAKLGLSSRTELVRHALAAEVAPRGI